MSRHHLKTHEDIQTLQYGTDRFYTAKIHHFSCVKTQKNADLRPRHYNTSKKKTVDDSNKTPKTHLNTVTESRYLFANL